MPQKWNVKEVGLYLILKGSWVATWEWRGRASCLSSSSTFKFLPGSSQLLGSVSSGPFRTVLFPALLLEIGFSSLTWALFLQVPLLYCKPAGCKSGQGPSNCSTALCCPLLPAANGCSPSRPSWPQGSDAWVIPVSSFWLLVPLVQQTIYSQTNLPEISFHVRSSSIVVVRCTDWRQAAWVLFQLCHLLTVWSQASWLNSVCLSFLAWKMGW